MHHNTRLITDGNQNYAHFISINNLRQTQSWEEDFWDFNAFCKAGGTLNVQRALSAKIAFLMVDEPF